MVSQNLSSAAVVIGVLKVKTDSNIESKWIISKPLIKYAICRKPDQNRIMNNFYSNPKIKILTSYKPMEATILNI